MIVKCDNPACPLGIFHIKYVFVRTKVALKTYCQKCFEDFSNA